jgi:acetyl esterase/lipase
MQEVLRQLFELHEQAPAKPSLEEMRDGFEKLWAAYSPQPGVNPVSVAVGGVSAAWLVAPDAANNRVIVYLHGGGFRVGSITSHLAICVR